MSAPAHTPSLVVMTERTAAAVAALRFQLTMGADTLSTTGTAFVLVLSMRAQAASTAILAGRMINPFRLVVAVVMQAAYPW